MYVKILGLHGLSGQIKDSTDCTLGLRTRDTMSRNRLQDLVAPSPMQNDSQTYEQGEYNRFDKERTGERYELQDRTGQKFDLNEFLTEVSSASSVIEDR